MWSRVGPASRRVPTRPGGYLVDANIALGNLVDIVRREAHEYLIESVSE